MGAAVDEKMIEYRSGIAAVPPMAWAVVGPVYPSRPVVRLDCLSSSMSSSIRCNTPSGGLVGAAPQVVSSVYGLPPFGADNVARRGKPAWDPSHMLECPQTHPSESVVLKLKYAHSVAWFACAWFVREQKMSHSSTLASASRIEVDCPRTQFWETVYQ